MRKEEKGVHPQIHLGGKLMSKQVNGGFKVTVV